MQYVEKIVTRLISGLRIEGYVEPYVTESGHAAPTLISLADHPADPRPDPLPALDRELRTISPDSRPSPPLPTPTTPRSGIATWTPFPATCPGHSGPTAGLSRA